MPPRLHWRTATKCSRSSRRAGRIERPVSKRANLGKSARGQPAGQLLDRMRALGRAFRKSAGTARSPSGGRRSNPCATCAAARRSGSTRDRRRRPAPRQRSCRRDHGARACTARKRRRPARRLGGWPPAPRRRTRARAPPRAGSSRRRTRRPARPPGAAAEARTYPRGRTSPARPPRAALPAATASISSERSTPVTRTPRRANSTVSEPVPHAQSHIETGRTPARSSSAR